MSDSAPAASLAPAYRGAVVAGGLTLACAAVLYAQVGATLGLLFGGMVVVTLVLPPMVLWERGFWRQGLVASAVNDAVEQNQLQEGVKHAPRLVQLHLFAPFMTAGPSTCVTYQRLLAACAGDLPRWLPTVRTPHGPSLRSR